MQSKRSTKDIQELKTIFKSMPTNLDYKMALKGLEDGEQMEEVLNDKYLYSSQELDLERSHSNKSYTSSFVDILIYKKLLKRYKLGVHFWRSL